MRSCKWKCLVMFAVFGQCPSRVPAILIPPLECICSQLKKPAHHNIRKWTPLSLTKGVTCRCMTEARPFRRPHFVFRKYYRYDCGEQCISSSCQDFLRTSLHKVEPLELGRLVTSHADDCADTAYCSQQTWIGSDLRHSD